MVFLFRIISDEDESFYRDLVVDESDTFLDFHQSLQESLGYDSAQLASFFITNERWERQQEITLIDMMQEQDQAAVTMDQAVIGDYITDADQRMIYVFDFFSERAFYIELLETANRPADRKTPFIGHSEGNPPPQLNMDLQMKDPVESLDGFDPEVDDTGDIRLEDFDLDSLESGITEDF